jgi:hypothetical protein
MRCRRFGVNWALPSSKVGSATAARILGKARVEAVKEGIGGGAGESSHLPTRRQSSPSYAFYLLLLSACFLNRNDSSPFVISF